MFKIRVDVLDRDLRRSKRLVDEGADRLHSMAGRILLQSVIEDTRVDTGRAVSNWRVGVGQPTRAVIEPYSPGEKGSTADANRAAALSVGMARIAGKRPGNEIFISNNVDYTDFVPGLWQAVDRAMDRARIAVDAMRIL